MKMRVQAYRLWKVVLVIALPCLLAVKCNGTPQASFSSSPEVLRGHWSGTMEQEFETTGFRFMQLEATLLNANEYAFEGTFQIGSDFEAHVEGVGSVATQFRDAVPDSVLSPQMPPPPPPPFEFTATVRSTSGTALWEFTGTIDRYTGGSYWGTARDIQADTAYRFSLRPLWERMPHVIGFSTQPNAVSTGETTTFSWSAVDPAGGILTCTLHPGGRTPAYTIHDCGNNNTQEHVFNEEGTFESSLVVGNSLGETTEAELIIHVTEPASGAFER